MRVFPPTAPRSFATFILAAVIVVVPCSIANAAPILLSFDATLAQPGFLPVTDDDLAVGSGVEVEFLNGTNLGNLMFDDEFIDVTSDASSTLLAYMIQGGYDAHPTTGYSTAWPLGTSILFYDFVLDQPGTLDSVSVSVNGVVGAAGGPLVDGVDYIVNGLGGSTLQIQLFNLGILDVAGQTPLGLMTFHLNFVADDPVEPVPDTASTLSLLGMSIAALAARRRLAGRL